MVRIRTKRKSCKLFEIYYNSAAVAAAAIVVGVDGDRLSIVRILHTLVFDCIHRRQPDFLFSAQKSIVAVHSHSFVCRMRRDKLMRN